MNKVIRLFIAILCLIAFAPCNSQAGVISITPYTDGTAVDYNGDLVFDEIDRGGSTLLVSNREVKSEPWVHIARAFMEFDTRAIDTSSVQSATLNIRVTQWGSINQKLIDIHGATGNGVASIDDVEFNNKIASHEITNPGALKYHSIDVTNFISGNEDDFVKLMTKYSVEGFFSGYTGVFTFASSNWEGLEPYLEISGDSIQSSPTPIPGAVWLLGSGLVGLVGFRRKIMA